MWSILQRNRFENLVLISLVMSMCGHRSRAQKENVKLNIRHMPLDPQNASDILEIGIMILIIDLEPFVELDMDFRIDYLMRQVWHPHSNYCSTMFDDLEISPTRKRLMKSIVLYDEKELKKIWLPETFASNSKDERVSSDTDSLEMVILALLPEKKCIIEYWSKLNAKLNCRLNFESYPFDKQFCNMTIRNYAVNRKLVRYKWLTKNDIDWKGFKNDERVFLSDGVVQYYPIRLIQYDVEVISGTYIEESFYIPSALLLSTAWLSLWIDVDEVGRVFNPVTCFLAMLTQFIHIRSRLPVITYINFTIVKYLQQNMIKQDQENKNRKSNLADDGALNAYLMQRNRERFQMVKKLKSISRIDENTASKRDELIKYLAILKIPKKGQLNVHSNQRLDFVAKKDRVESKPFISRYDRPFEFDSTYLADNNYDRVLKERVEKLVKYNSSSSSSSDSDSEEEETWYQQIKHDHEVRQLITKIDNFSKIFFPVLFFIFNCFYWPYMINISG